MSTKSLFVFAIILCAITMVQPYLCPRFIFLNQLPILIAGIRPGASKRRIDNILASIIWCVYYAILMYPMSYILYFIPYHWLLLWSYHAVFLLVYHHYRNTLADKLWFRLMMKVFVTPPLLLSYQIVSASNGQLSAPLISIIDDNICVGALPLTEKDVLKLYKPPYNIRGVINLCDEAVGPKCIYPKYDIKYLQLKTIDSTPPSIDDIAVGIKFIQKILQFKNKENNDCRRVFIHCKLGRG
eukprot:430671_1